MAKDKKDVLIDSHVSTSQFKKAIAALVQHATKIAKQKEETELLPGKEENVWLVLSVKKMTPEKKLKPFKIPLAHPIIDPRTSPICLITKDPQREYKDLLESHNIKFIHRVVGVTKLKGKFKPFEARRMLLRENGLFFADERVVPLLPGLLGKMFFNAKKQPIPVCLTKKDLKKQLEQAVSSTYMHQNQGTCASIKVGVISQSPEHILENLQTALPEIVKRVNGEWDNIQSLHIKTNSSISLPIWTCSLGEGEDGRWNEVKQDDTADVLPGEESDSDEELVAKSKSKNEKKRAAVEDNRPSNKKKSKTTPLEREVEPVNEKENAKPVSKSHKQKHASKTSVEDQSDDLKRKRKHKDVGTVSDTEKPVEPKSASERASSTKMSKRPSSGASASEAQSVPAKAAPKESLSSRTKSTPTNDEIKKKRLLSDGLEKKKEKLAKKRLGGSIKESVIGKKAKARV